MNSEFPDSPDDRDVRVERKETAVADQMCSPGRVRPDRLAGCDAVSGARGAGVAAMHSRGAGVPRFGGRAIRRDVAGLARSYGLWAAPPTVNLSAGCPMAGAPIPGSTTEGEAGSWRNYP
ncbi:hypothetical protein GCM10018791_45560 [Streptomyces zaomyceticus]|nr:hypothetical protein GCM10018791_45560 [Streptomyces zaomyceticus]